MTLNIAIIDCIGLDYDGDTLTKKGIGGSESSIISISKELVKLGQSVTVFNNCESPEASPGVYDGVVYKPISDLSTIQDPFDVVISQRTVIPFTPKHLYDQVKQPAPRDYNPDWFVQLQGPNTLKILWMQDTFIWGDSLLEPLVVHGHIDEIFNLSDWHIAYTTNCEHGPKRIYEVLKDKIFHTRNGINKWIDEVDIIAKDPNLFVYNASITKGMEPLVKKIWPKLKQHLPDAKLKIVGGYYDFKNEPDTPFKKQWQDLYESSKHEPSIEFTGIIPQPEIAKLLAKASYMLYPGAYPETSGISSIESIAYNTPIIGTRFGAMPESGTESASYFIDYAIEPNGLFPWINTDEQVDRYVNLVLSVVNNPYLHQQKMYACNNVKDICTWDTIALQWKQHLFAKLNVSMDDEEQKKAQWINYRVHKVFEKRFMNPEELLDIKKPSELTKLIQEKARVCFIDIVGVAYDGSTLQKRGLGGSESAVILVSKELSDLGLDVTVYNACDEEDCEPGLYNGVTYKPLSAIGNDNETFDVVISSRAVNPFIPEYMYNYQATSHRKIDYNKFKKLRDNAKLKVMWMHDTFCWGDDVLEHLVVNDHINELWTLSDFHNNYISYCTHPTLRNYESLRNHLWITRNGMVKFTDKVNLKKKDPNLFVFNSNMSKGLNALLNHVWPRVKKRLPDARLCVIGGRYKLGKAFAEDTEESEFENLVSPHLDDPTITFAGILTLEEISKIYSKATYLIYPGTFPETYGISTLEALYHNMTVLSCKFGALEETGRPGGYLIPYAAMANALKHDIDVDAQSDIFVDMVVTAYNEHSINRTKHLDEIKDIAGWDTVAVEWKQHIYSKLGKYLSREESQQALYSKYKYQRIFGRRTSTSEQWIAPAQTTEQKIVVISPFYNAQDYIADCINSVAAQMYDNYEHWLIDDCSTDGTVAATLKAIGDLPENIQSKFKFISNSINYGAVYNQIQAIRELNDSDIVMLLDGDDKLKNSPDIFTYYNELHQNNDFTYGSCWSIVDNIPLISQPYPEHIKKNRAYKHHKFNWVLPYTHLRTLKAKLLKYEPDETFIDPTTEKWFKAGGDLSTFYTAIEACDPEKVYVTTDIMYMYNDASPLNDYKINSDEQNKTVKMISKSSSKPTKAYIMRNVENHLSVEYAKECAESCDKVGLPWEYYDGVYMKSVDELWSNSDLVKNYQKEMVNGVASCTENHIQLWKNIAENKETAVILEHDSLVLYPIDSEIPDNCIVALGYKLKDISLYDHVSAGAPKYLKYIDHHQGSHAYAINHVTATKLLKELSGGYLTGVDNRYFSREGEITSVPLAILDPTPVIGHLKQSTIWYTPLELNEEFIESFKENYNKTIPAVSTDLVVNKTKRILIAIPCKNDIEADTFKSIYDLEVPEGYETEFQYFYGYAVDQVRNLIASWVVNAYDYLFAVDHDVTFASDTLVKLISADKPAVGGIYRQRVEPQMIEIYDTNYFRLPYEALYNKGLVEVGAMGFGCILVKKEVFADVGYPQFVYHQSLNHNETFSEDIDFCKKAREKGYTIWCDTSIQCGHIGRHTYTIQPPETNLITQSVEPEEDEIKRNLRQYASSNRLPQTHIDYLSSLNDGGFKPKVIYDIGACVLHWTNSAKTVWPDSRYIVFDAMRETEFLYQEQNLGYVCGSVLYHTDNIDLEFYENLTHPSGNSIYQENELISPAAHLYSNNNKVIRKGMTLDTLVKQFNFELPDLIKMDVQGAELDVLRGAQNTLKNCNHLILELQEEDYNKNAPKLNEVEQYLNSIGFVNVSGKFSECSQFDGDYHFVRL